MFVILMSIIGVLSLTQETALRTMLWNLVIGLGIRTKYLVNVELSLKKPRK